MTNQMKEAQNIRLSQIEQIEKVRLWIVYICNIH